MKNELPRPLCGGVVHSKDMPIDGRPADLLLGSQPAQGIKL
jgi:hypothetical protein